MLIVGSSMEIGSKCFRVFVIGDGIANFKTFNTYNGADVAGSTCGFSF
jgi:hypothetical protein